MKHAVNSPASPEVPTAGGGELALLKASSLGGHSLEGKTWTRKTRKSHLPGSVTPPKLPTFRLRVPCSQIKHGQENLWFISFVFIQYLLKVYTGPSPWVTHWILNISAFWLCLTLNALKDFWGVGLSLSVFVALASSPGPDKECAFN